MLKYSAFDIQLGKICEVCNKRSAKTVINGIKKIIANDGDIDGLSDNEVFAEWGYVLFAHNKRVSANNVVSLEYLSGYDNIEIILPEFVDTSGIQKENLDVQ